MLLQAPWLFAAAFSASALLCSRCGKSPSGHTHLLLLHSYCSGCCSGGRSGSSRAQIATHIPYTACKLTNVFYYPLSCIQIPSPISLTHKGTAPTVNSSCRPLIQNFKICIARATSHPHTGCIIKHSKPNFKITSLITSISTLKRKRKQLSVGWK